MVIEPGEPLGEHFLATIEDDDATARVVELDIETANGVPRCTAFTIRKQSGVASRDIRVPLERYLDVVARHPARVLEGRQRRELTDDFLRAVADAYSAAGGHVSGIRPEVDSRFHASESQKFRWVKAARTRGFLADREEK